MSKDLNIIKKYESADLEEFKRPDHNDFRTSLELRAEQFSGNRHNSLTNEMELWIHGELRLSMPMEIVRAYPEKWEKAFADVMGLKVKVEMLPPQSN